MYPKLIINSHKFVKLTNRNAVYALEFSLKGKSPNCKIDLLEAS